MEELQPPTRIPSVGPREGWVAASSPMQGAGGVTAVGVLRTLKNGRRCADGALGQESCYLGPALRLEAVRCCRRGRVSDFPQSRTTRVSTVTHSEVTSFGAENRSAIWGPSGSTDRRLVPAIETLRGSRRVESCFRPRVIPDQIRERGENRADSADSAAGDDLESENSCE